MSPSEKPAGVLLVRDDGVIVVRDAVPVDTKLQRAMDALCEMLGAPKPKHVDDR